MTLLDVWFFGGFCSFWWFLGLDASFGVFMRVLRGWILV